MWNEGVIIFFKSTRFPLHQSTRLPAHYQLTLLKLYFTAWLLASVYECEISGLKLTQKYHQSNPWRNSLCLNWRKWVLGAAVSHGRQGGRQLVFSTEPSTLSMDTGEHSHSPTIPRTSLPSWDEELETCGRGLVKMGTLGISHPGFISRWVNPLEERRGCLGFVNEALKDLHIS